jgi:ADP-heptose:LPS heptosyltransferase
VNRRGVIARDYRAPMLALRALGLGDLLTIVPALRGLRRAHPEYRVVLACSGWLHPLAARIDSVDETIAVDGLVPFCSRLPPVLAVNLHGRGPRSHRALLNTHPAGLVAFEHPDVPESWGMPKWHANEHEVARWCRLLNECGIPCDRHELALDRAPFVGLAPAAAKGATVIHPGAAAPSRCWPAERFAAVARDELQRGNRVVVTGSVDDEPRCRAVAGDAGLDEDSVLIGSDIVRFAGTVAVADRVVCGDTGAAHLASAFGTPSVVLFGPVAPSEWGPPPRRVHRALWAGTRGDPHARETDRGLLAIGVDDVLQALRSVSNDSAPLPQ